MDKVQQKRLMNFLREQKLMTIATVDGDKPWICNVFFSVDDDFNFFFVGPTDTKHAEHFTKNPQVAFSIGWYNNDDLSDRKAIQATGKVKRLTDAKEIARFVANHHKYYPIWKNVITAIKMRKKLIQSRPFVIKPDYIKFWNDKAFGDEGVEEYWLSS